MKYKYDYEDIVNIRWFNEFSTTGHRESIYGRIIDRCSNNDGEPCYWVEIITVLDKYETFDDVCKVFGNHLDEEGINGPRTEAMFWEGYLELHKKAPKEIKQFGIVKFLEGVNKK